ncbi:alpha/beta hydrolase fold domain-containing protein [Mycobacterium ostraviense]|nr:alpha/beta hydrolase [Mycobacterium ostraviense]UGT93480.1 alpha/beta hydrolase [Mycobacterium ostraviense]
MLRITGRTRQYTTAADARKHITARALRPSPYGPPVRLRPDVTVEVGRRSGWPIYTVAPKNGAHTHTVVYLHGGAWVNEINSQHWRLVTHVAAEARVKVVVPIYPLLPFGTAADVVPEVAHDYRIAPDGLLRHSTACRSRACYAPIVRSSTGGCAGSMSSPGTGFGRWSVLNSPSVLVR